MASELQDDDDSAFDYYENSKYTGNEEGRRQFDKNSDVYKKVDDDNKRYNYENDVDEDNSIDEDDEKSVFDDNNLTEIEKEDEKFILENGRLSYARRKEQQQQKQQKNQPERQRTSRLLPNNIINRQSSSYRRYPSSSLKFQNYHKSRLDAAIDGQKQEYLHQQQQQLQQLQQQQHQQPKQQQQQQLQQLQHLQQELQQPSTHQQNSQLRLRTSSKISQQLAAGSIFNAGIAASSAASLKYQLPQLIDAKLPAHKSSLDDVNSETQLLSLSPKFAKVEDFVKTKIKNTNKIAIVDQLNDDQIKQQYKGKHLRKIQHQNLKADKKESHEIRLNQNHHQEKLQQQQQHQPHNHLPRSISGEEDNLEINRAVDDDELIVGEKVATNLQSANPLRPNTNNHLQITNSNNILNTRNTNSLSDISHDNSVGIQPLAGGAVSAPITTIIAVSFFGIVLIGIIFAVWLKKIIFKEHNKTPKILNYNKTLNNKNETDNYLIHRKNNDKSLKNIYSDKVVDVKKNKNNFMMADDLNNINNRSPPYFTPIGTIDDNKFIFPTMITEPTIKTAESPILYSALSTPKLSSSAVTISMQSTSSPITSKAPSLSPPIVSQFFEENPVKFTIGELEMQDKENDNQTTVAPIRKDEKHSRSKGRPILVKSLSTIAATPAFLIGRKQSSQPTTPSAISQFSPSAITSPPPNSRLRRFSHYDRSSYSPQRSIVNTSGLQDPQNLKRLTKLRNDDNDENLITNSYERILQISPTSSSNAISSSNSSQTTIVSNISETTSYRQQQRSAAGSAITSPKIFHDNKENAAPFGDLNSPKLKISEQVLAQQNSPRIFESPTALGIKFSFSPKLLSNNMNEAQQNQTTIQSPLITNSNLLLSSAGITSSPLLSSAICRQGDYFKFPEVDCFTPHKSKLAKKFVDENINSSENIPILLSPSSEVVNNKNIDNEPRLRPTMATRRARLKSISLDSDGARLVEDNLGVPVEELIEIANQSQNVHDDCFIFDNNNVSTYYNNHDNLINTTILGTDIGATTIATKPANMISNTTTASSVSDLITPISLIDNDNSYNDGNSQPIKKSKSKNKNHLTIDITKEQLELTKEKAFNDGNNPNKPTSKTPKTPKTPVLSSKQKAFSLDSSDSSQFSHVSGHSLSNSATTSFVQISSMPATPKHHLRQQQQRSGSNQQNPTQVKQSTGQQNFITDNLLVNLSAPRINTEEIDEETPSNFGTNNISSGYLTQYRKGVLSKVQKSSKYLSSHQTKSSSVMTSSTSTPSSSFDQTKSFDRNSSSSFMSKLGSFNENTYDDDYCDYYNYILDGDGRIIVVEEHDDDPDNQQLDEDDSSSLSKDEKIISQNRSSNESNLLGLNLQNQKSATSLNISNNNLKTLPEVMTLSDFSINTDDEDCKILIKNNNAPIIINRTPRNSILQRRGSNHSLTLNLNGSYGNLTKGLSISNYSLGSNSQYNLCGSTANISAQQSSMVKVPIIEGDVIDLDATSAFLIGGNCAAATTLSGVENNRKNLLQRRGSNTSLTLNIRGSSSMNLNRFNSHSSLNIAAQQQQHQLNQKLANSQASSVVGSCNIGQTTKKGLLERRNSNTSLTLNIQTRGLSISNVNLRGSACSLNSVSTNPTDCYEPHAIIIDEHVNTDNVDNNGVGNASNDIENYSSTTGTGSGYQNRRRFLSSENLNSMTQCSKLNQTHIRNSTKTCFGSVSDLKPTYQYHQQPSSSMAIITNQSHVQPNQSLIQDDKINATIGGNVGIIGKEYHNYDKPISLKKSNIRSNISRFDFSNLDKPIADDRYSNFEQGTLCSCTGVRNITTRPLSPQTTSEDFKMYLANIQLLQNASNILNADHLRKLNYVFEKSYNDNNSSSSCNMKATLQTEKIKRIEKSLFDHGVLSTSDNVSNVDDENVDENVDENDVENEINNDDNQKITSDEINVCKEIVENNYGSDLNCKDTRNLVKQKSNDLIKNHFQIPNSEEQKKLLIHLHQEFWDLPTNYQEKPMVFGSQAKNRYDSILPNEHSRVMLEYEPGCQQEPYINANYIKGPDFTQNSYIATQGPMANTIYEYWLMIYQNINKFDNNNNDNKACINSSSSSKSNPQITSNQKIIMLTDFIENNRQKCSIYFPIDKNDTYLISTTNDELSHNVEINNFYKKYLLNSNETDNNDDSDDNDDYDYIDNNDDNDDVDHNLIINKQENPIQMSNKNTRLPLIQSYNLNIDNENILKILPKTNYFIIKTISVISKNGYQIRKLICLYCQNQINCNNSKINVTTSKTNENTSISNLGRKQKVYRFICYHYWYPDWPDHRSPSDINVLLEISLHFLNNRCNDEFNNNNYNNNDNNNSNQFDDTENATALTPVWNISNMLFDNFELNFYNQPLPIIHCSAGIGRTGCFAAVLNGLRQMHSTMLPISPPLLQSVSLPSTSDCLAITKANHDDDHKDNDDDDDDDDNDNDDNYVELKNVIDNDEVNDVDDDDNDDNDDYDDNDDDKDDYDDNDDIGDDDGNNDGNNVENKNDSNNDNDNNDKSKETPSQSILKKYFNPNNVSKLSKATIINNKNQLKYCKKMFEVNNVINISEKDIEIDSKLNDCNDCNPTKSKTEKNSATIELSSQISSKLILQTNILSVDILGIVCNLRLQRGGMVQNSEQYELIHRALCLYLKQWDNIILN